MTQSFSVYLQAPVPWLPAWIPVYVCICPCGRRNPCTACPPLCTIVWCWQHGDYPWPQTRQPVVKVTSHSLLYPAIKNEEIPESMSKSTKQIKCPYNWSSAFLFMCRDYLEVIKYQFNFIHILDKLEMFEKHKCPPGAKFKRVAIAYMQWSKTGG